MAEKLLTTDWNRAGNGTAMSYRVSLYPAVESQWQSRKKTLMPIKVNDAE